jgi:2',3'-cyclic-nucleotide 2'-phosphodiesterase (5'-nucleotidase family)
MTITRLLLTILLCGLTTSASAKLLQIIHTNDLHSFFDGSRTGLGGYSRIKTVVDKLKADAEAKGIKTLFLDAGDFGEGGSYYYSNKGLDAFRALDLLGIDVTVLGNHDFMLGGEDLNRQIVDSELKANVLSANLIGRKRMGLKNKIKNYVDYDLDGMKIRIFGLTTPEIHYQYPLLPHGFIGPSHKKGIAIAEKSQRDGVDFLIGLTHIGVGKDEILASHSRSINMIIGGHSHTRLDQPIMVENLEGELVPVVQTGAHGMAVGSAIIDVLGDGEAKMIDYRLYDISKDILENDELRNFVDEAYVNRERYFNRSWNEVIGFSEIPLTGMVAGKVKDPKSCWSQHIARLSRLTAKTDLAIQFDIFQGEEIPAGPIHFGDLIDNFPHSSGWGDQGWNINRSRVSGFVLNTVLKALSSADEPFDTTIDGLEVYDGTKGMNIRYLTGGIHKPENAILNGSKIDNLKFYTVALPSEIPFGVSKFSTPLRDILLMNSQAVENSYFWPLFEDYLAKNSPLKCLDN